MSDQEWYDALPSDIQNAPIFKVAEDGTVKTIEQVVLDLTNLTQVAGNSLRMPGPDAGDEDIAKFQSRVMEKVPGLMTKPNLEDDDSIAAHFTKMGKPATAEDYKTPEIEGFELDDPGGTKATAHAMNMTQKQFTAWVNDQAKAATLRQDKLNLQHEEQLGVIKNEWGAAFEQNMAAVGKLVKENTLAPKELAEAFDKKQLPASMLRYLLNMSELGAEGTTFQTQTDGSDVIPIPAEAMSQLVEVENRLFDKNMHPSDPQYALLTAKRNKLIRQAYPDASLDVNSMRA